MQTTLGQALRQERESRGYSLDEISRNIQIQIRYLEAMEADDYGQLPPNLYLKYYIRSYLHCLRVDETDFFQTYHDELNKIIHTGEETPMYQRLEKVRFSRFRKRRLLLMAIIFVAVVTIVILMIVKATDFTLFSEKSSRMVSNIPQTNSVALALKEGIPTENVELADHTQTSSAIDISLHFQDTCWIQAEPKGQPLFERTYLKGENFHFSGEELRLLIGNPGAVKLLINGRDFSPFANPDRPKRLHFSRENLPYLLTEMNYAQKKPD